MKARENDNKTMTKIEIEDMNSLADWIEFSFHRSYWWRIVTDQFRFGLWSKLKPATFMQANKFSWSEWVSLYSRRTV